MKFQIRIPRFVSSTLQSGSQRVYAVLDGRAVTIPNRWGLPPHTVAVVGRPAVWSIIDIETPRIPLVFTAIPEQRLHLEQDFGGHLFAIVISADGARANVIEAGPEHEDGSGALLPYAYPEDDFVREGVIDFEPIVIAAPNGLSREFFANLVKATHRDYDGDQRYAAVEIPFLRVGRDSNSYVVGILASCGVDPREMPLLKEAMRWEWTGYPGMEDPVHRANFGTYLGTISPLGDALDDVAYHNADGSVRYAVVGGEPGAVVTLPCGERVTLDRLGRIVLAPDDAKRLGLPTTHTEPPEQIRERRRFPSEPSPAGAELTLVVDGKSVPLVPGATYTGTIVARNDALFLATLRTNDDVDIVLPIAELGVELRDPKRVDRLFRVDSRLSVGLRRDRHPRLKPHGNAWLRDRFGPRRFHAPNPMQIAVSTTLGLGVAALASFAFARIRRREI